jgi:hypothetical protein
VNLKTLLAAAAISIAALPAKAEPNSAEINLMIAATAFKAAKIITCGGAPTAEDEKMFAQIDGLGLKGELTKRTLAALDVFKERNIDPKTVLCTRF